MSLMRRMSLERFEEVMAELGVLFTTLGEHHYAAKQGSTVVEIRAEPYKARDLLIQVSANVVEGASFSEDLGRKLLDLNVTHPFGSFGLDAQGNVVFRHCLIGSTLDVKELKTSFKSVAETADEWDDKLVELAGGKRASESERWAGVAWKGSETSESADS